MLRIKRLYVFLIKTFLPLFVATFSVCLFILLMQFLWKYVDDMVGKGLDFLVLGKMFFYAALFSVPMALPLAVLLASLMTFGNLGEKFELLAMKASGISLLRVMRPTVVFVFFIAAGAFFFQNNALPPTQIKLWTLLHSIRLKSPELDIPSKTFFKEIDKYNLYISHKNPKTGMMYNLMIYDFRDGFNNAKVTVADSGRLKTSDDKLHLILTIYNGESFENLKKQTFRNRNEKIPYRREKFDLKEVLIAFDANFTMEDESIASERDFSKNLNQLRVFIDSVTVEKDSIDKNIVKNLQSYTYQQALWKSTENTPNHSFQTQTQDTTIIADFDSLFNEKDLSQQQKIVSNAKARAENIKSEYQYNNFTQAEKKRALIGHRIEMHRKFTLSFACLIFLFIGAPLGSIIRKGGLGMPAVLSVILFLFYYSVDIFSVKLARQSVLPVWAGMWASSFILLALGLFLTYKAVNDSVMFNADAWTGFFKRLIGKRETRNYQRKDVIMTPPDYKNDMQLIENLTERCNKYLNAHKKKFNYINFWKHAGDNACIESLGEDLELIIEDLRNSDENYIIGKLMDYPVINSKQPAYIKNPQIRLFCTWFFPVGIALYLWELYKGKELKREIEIIRKVNNELLIEIKKKL
ncbi:MAG: LptF/LptG family permease [Dysgonamonadaceae bacterium]|nr:LptF/LptG family permease [Dysgonamonadaceae bacterium]